MKHKFLVPISAIIVLLSAVAFSTGTDILGTLDMFAVVGDMNISVPVTLVNSEPVAIMEFQVNHSSYLTFKGVTNTTRMQNSTIVYNNISSTSTKVVIFVPDNISAGNGTIMNLVFDVKLFAIPGVYALTTSNVIAMNAETDLEFNTTSSIFTII